MNLHVLSSNWKKAGNNDKTKGQLKAMTQVRNHPKIKRIRVRLIFESTLLIIFLLVYRDIFDGAEKPLWSNILLIISVVIFVITDISGLLILQKPVRNIPIRDSLRKLLTGLRQMHLLSVSSSLLLGLSLVLFFSSTVLLTTDHYFLLTGIMTCMLIISYLSHKNWTLRIRSIEKSLQEFL